MFKVSYIDFKRRMEIENIFLDWCKENNVANVPNSLVAFMDSQGWLCEKKILEDLNKRETEEEWTELRQERRIER